MTPPRVLTAGQVIAVTWLVAVYVTAIWQWIRNLHLLFGAFARGAIKL